MEAWHSQTWWLIIPALYFGYQSLSNAGCASCPTPSATAEKEPTTVDVDYDEVT